VRAELTKKEREKILLNKRVRCLVGSWDLGGKKLECHSRIPAAIWRSSDTSSM